MAKKFQNERAQIQELLAKFLTENDYEVLHTGTQELCIPIVDSEGEEGYIVLNLKVPTGQRDGTPYDGYEEAEAFAEHQRAMKEKAKEKEIQKQKKIEHDKKIREIKEAKKKEREANA